MMYTVERIRQWLVDESEPHAGPNEDQDFDHQLADEFTASQLMSLFYTENTVGTRIEAIAHAICGRIRWLEEPDDDPMHIHSDEDRAAERSILLEFVSSNLSAFQLIHRRAFLGDFFDDAILPALEGKSKGSDGHRRSP